LNSLQRLRKLRLDVKGGNTDRLRLRALSGLQSLRELELFGRDVSDEVMPYVCSLKNLESLRVWDAPISEQGLSRLPSLKALKRLNLGSLNILNRSCIEAIGKLNSLEELRIHSQVEQGALSALVALPKLETVAIGGPEITRMLTELKDVSTIRTLEISQAEVDSRSAEFLGGIKNLKVLKLERCVVTPEAVRILQSLKLRRIECIGINSDVIGELARSMSECVGNLEIAK
jgi:hypothetical protein